MSKTQAHACCHRGVEKCFGSCGVMPAREEKRVKHRGDLLWPDRWKVVQEQEAGHGDTRAGVGTQGQAGKQGGGGSERHPGAPGKSWSALGAWDCCPGVEAVKGKLLHH